MDIFKTEKVAVLPSNNRRKCRFCEQELEHVAVMMDSDTGHLIQMFKCECGERTWDE
jgi:hypothetical protein